MKSVKTIIRFNKKNVVACVAALMVSSAMAEARAELSINPYPLGMSSAHSETQVRQEIAPAAPVMGDFAPLDITAPQSGGPVYSAPSFPVYNAPAFNSAPMAVIDVPRTDEWKAFRGSNLQEIIDSWSQSSGVQVIWNTYSDYRVEDTLVLQGTYEAALESLLSQYNKDYIRPVGSLHIDPISGQKTLVVVTYEGS